MPALILLSSIIDTIGAYFRGTSAIIIVNEESKKIETVSDHFLILNHEKLFDLNLSGKTIYDFYSKYRSLLTHNNTLPPNASLDLGKETERSFLLNQDQEIIKVNLKPLFTKVKAASDTFIYYLETGNWSEDHKLSQEIESKGNTSGGSLDSLTITASTGSNTIEKDKPKL